MSNHLPEFMVERTSKKDRAREGEREKDYHFAGKSGKGDSDDDNLGNDLEESGAFGSESRLPRSQTM